MLAERKTRVWGTLERNGIRALLPRKVYCIRLKQMEYTGVITFGPVKRGRKARVRGLRVAVIDVLKRLAGGMP
jgi:hypothetical protein